MIVEKAQQLNGWKAQILGKKWCFFYVLLFPDRFFRVWRVQWRKKEGLSMKRPLHFPPPKILIGWLGLLLLCFLLTAARLGGSYAPFSLALTTAAGAGFPAFFCLLGDAIGAWLFLDFQPGLRHLAAAALIVSGSLCFCDTKYYRQPRFRPALSGVLTALVQAIYLYRRSLFHTASFLLALALQVMLSVFLIEKWPELEQLWRRFGTVKKGKSTALQREMRVLLGFALALSVVGVTSKNDFSLGRALLGAVLLYCVDGLTPAQGAVLGFCAGLAADLANAHPQPIYTVLCTGGCALAALFPRRRMLASLGFGVSAVVTPLLFGADMPLSFLWEALFGMTLHMILPRRGVGRRLASATEEKKTEREKNRWEKSAAAFRELYDSFFRGTEPAAPENPSVIFDRAAEEVCRSCVLCSHCWHENYNATYNAFNDACPKMLRQGEAKAGDFPTYFTSRCVHLSSFLVAVNGELRAFLQRQQYRRRLQETRSFARQQYAQMGEMLSGAATAEAVEAMACQPLGYRMGSALRPKDGEQVCGDQLDVFEVGGTLYLLLSDGMGSGEGAHREAAMTVRLLRQFLEAGIEPAPALKTLNAALALRGEDGGGFTTVDLLELQRCSGSAVLYKYGAAPSYLKRYGTVTRFAASSLPAGLQQGDRPPEQTRLSLTGGSYFVMVSDGIADENNDEWLLNLLAGWNGGDATELTRLILSESRSRKGLEDDCAVLVVQLPPPAGSGKTGV